jgi:hypothetical protein
MTGSEGAFIQRGAAYKGKSKGIEKQAVEQGNKEN